MFFLLSFKRIIRKHPPHFSTAVTTKFLSIYVFYCNFGGLGTTYEVISGHDSILEHGCHIGMDQLEGLPRHVHC